MGGDNVAAGLCSRMIKSTIHDPDLKDVCEAVMNASKGHPSILLLAGHLEAVPVALCFIAIAAYCLVFDFGIERMDASLETQPVESRQLLARIKDELMNLGVLSFLLFIWEQSFDISNSVFLALEFAHVVILAVGMLFIVQLYLVTRGMVARFHFWNSAFLWSKEDLLEEQADLEQIETQLGHNRVHHGAAEHATAAYKEARHALKVSSSKRVRRERAAASSPVKSPGRERRPSMAGADAAAETADAAADAELARVVVAAEATEKAAKAEMERARELAKAADELREARASLATKQKRVRAQLQWHALKATVTRQLNPNQQDVDFALYLRKAVTAQLAQAAIIGWQSWFALVAVVLLQCGITHASSNMLVSSSGNSTSAGGTNASGIAAAMGASVHGVQISGYLLEWPSEEHPVGTLLCAIFTFTGFVLLVLSLVILRSSQSMRRTLLKTFALTEQKEEEDTTRGNRGNRSSFGMGGALGRMRKNFVSVQQKPLRVAFRVVLLCNTLYFAQYLIYFAVPVARSARLRWTLVLVAWMELVIMTKLLPLAAQDVFFCRAALAVEADVQLLNDVCTSEGAAKEVKRKVLAVMGSAVREQIVAKAQAAADAATHAGDGTAAGIPRGKSARQMLLGALGMGRRLSIVTRGRSSTTKAHKGILRRQKAARPEDAELTDVLYDFFETWRPLQQDGEAVITVESFTHALQHVLGVPETAHQAREVFRLLEAEMLRTSRKALLRKQEREELRGIEQELQKMQELPSLGAGQAKPSDAVGVEVCNPVMQQAGAVAASDADTPTDCCLGEDAIEVVAQGGREDRAATCSVFCGLISLLRCVLCCGNHGRGKARRANALVMRGFVTVDALVKFFVQHETKQLSKSKSHKARHQKGSRASVKLAPAAKGAVEAAVDTEVPSSPVTMTSDSYRPSRFYRTVL